MENTDISKGLTEKEVSDRIKCGKSNAGLDIRTKSVGQIVRENCLTLFNLINVLLAIAVALVGSYRNMLFMGVILCNTAIGIFQEIRSKRTIDKLSILSAPKARVIRDGKEKTIAVSDVVIDDILIIGSGSQVCADCVILKGSCETDESLVTGESDSIEKKEGDELLSGSFVTAGVVTAKAVRVGAESTSGKITGKAKYLKKRSSEMMNSINKIIKIVSVCIIPFGIVLFLKAFFVTQQSVENGVTSTVAALIGMIPEGLVLLTSVALAVSAIRLARNKTLCQDLYCVEQLARVDVLCLDKTGTITEGCMQVEEILPLNSDFDSDTALNAFAGAFSEHNSTLSAIGEKFPRGSSMTVKNIVPFSSARKWSSVEFADYGTLILGAPEFVLRERYSEHRDVCEKYARSGMRVLLLAYSKNPCIDNDLPNDITPESIIVLSDKIRPSAPSTLDYFRKQGVCIKVISGDDAVTVSNVAKRAGLENADCFVDLSLLSDDEITAAAEEYTVFGRVTPDRKLELVKALKAAGHKVAMTGDGVNDVPALKEADCSVAMQSGSDAARCVSQLVLQSSDFSSMPLVVGEGRRCINNIERSASLFLVKTIFSFLLSAVFLFIPFAYPLKPIQMTLVSALAVGVPSFLLALEPNKNLVHGGFLSNVLKKAAPGGLSVAVGIVLLMVSQSIFGFSDDSISTMAMFLVAIACFAVLWNVCRPFNKLRGAMYAVLIAVFVLAVIIIPSMFYITPLTGTEWLSLSVLAIIIIAIQIAAGLFLKLRKNK